MTSWWKRATRSGKDGVGYLLEHGRGASIRFSISRAIQDVFPLVHVKDLKKIPNPTVAQGSKIDGDAVVPLMTEVGSGVIDWKRIFAHSGQAASSIILSSTTSPRIQLRAPA